MSVVIHSFSVYIVQSIAMLIYGEGFKRRCHVNACIGEICFYIFYRLFNASTICLGGFIVGIFAQWHMSQIVVYATKKYKHVIGYTFYVTVFACILQLFIERYKNIGAYEEAFKLKSEGKVGCVGISFHDTADVLDGILTEYPEIEVVQLQVNYYDYEDKIVQSRLCLEVCKKHGKPVIVMEPVRGGMLASPPLEAKAVLEKLDGSFATWAIRFSASCDGVIMVLSGMGNMDMMMDNVSAMKSFKPITDAERAVLFDAAAAIRNRNIITCTSCRYCVPGCPMNIEIPELFTCLNEKRNGGSWQGEYFYELKTKNGSPASSCIECGACEEVCPQKLEIRELLKEVSREFDKK